MKLTARYDGKTCLVDHAERRTTLCCDVVDETGASVANIMTSVHDNGSRVWVSTSTIVVDGRGEERIEDVASHKLDPNEETDSYPVVSREMRALERFEIALGGDDIERLAAIVHAVASGARPEWG